MNKESVQHSRLSYICIYINLKINFFLIANSIISLLFFCCYLKLVNIFSILEPMVSKSPFIQDFQIQSTGNNLQQLNHFVNILTLFYRVIYKEQGCH